MPEPTSPILFGRPAPPGELLPWAWAEQRLSHARNYWIATTRSDGRPHTRVVWGIWLRGRFWFSTGSLARVNLGSNPYVTLHLEGGDEVVIVEGVADRLTDPALLADMCEAYSAKYNWRIRPRGDEVTDGDGNAGPAFRFTPEVAFGWKLSMGSPTRWRFGDGTVPTAG